MTIAFCQIVFNKDLSIYLSIYLRLLQVCWSVMGHISLSVMLTLYYKHISVEIASIATWGRLTPRQSFSTLTETPVPGLKSVNLSVAVLYNAFTANVHIMWRWSQGPWPFTFDLEHCMGRNMAKLCTRYEQNGTIRGKVMALQFQYLTVTLWPWTCVTCCAALG